MSQHVIHLMGCQPTPLAGYLKAFATLRLVALNCDPQARLFWKDEHAVLVSGLNKDQLLDFLCNDYEPTPVLSPQNGGAGFRPGENRDHLEAILACSAPRFAQYREAIGLCDRALAELGEADKDKEFKVKLLSKLGGLLRGRSSEWLTACCVVGDQGNMAFPSMFGTGGNDGRLEFSRNFTSALGKLFDLNSPEAYPQQGTRDKLRDALYRESPIRSTEDVPIGQYAPGSAGGANAGNGFVADSLANIWDLVLAIEGAVLFAGGISKRWNSEKSPKGAAPFAVNCMSLGAGASLQDEANNRGEQWLPLWPNPATLSEVQAMLLEGRAQIGESAATSPLDVARSLARMGLARGISACQRYGYLERRGLAYAAVPLERWQMVPQADQEVVDQAVNWLKPLERIASGDNAPASWKRAWRKCHEALMACCREGHGALCWENLLVSLGDVEAALAVGRSLIAKDRMLAAQLKPLRNLSAKWLQLIPSDAEVRLAIVLANIYGVDTQGQARFGDSIRCHVLPVAKGLSGNYDYYQFADSVEYVGDGQDFIRAAASILRRRLHLTSGGFFPLAAGRGLYAQLADVSAFVNGQLNTTRIWRLAKPLMALDWRDYEAVQQYKQSLKVASVKEDSALPAFYALLKLTNTSSSELGELAPITVDPAIATNALAGNTERASMIALRRLKASGYKPNMQVCLAEPTMSSRCVAALLFPLRAFDMQVLVKQICRTIVGD